VTPPKKVEDCSCDNSCICSEKQLALDIPVGDYQMKLRLF